MEIFKKIIRSFLYPLLSPFVFVSLLLPSTILAQEGNEKWSIETGGSVISSPASDSNGTIYVGSTDKKLYAVNSDGTLKWEFAQPTSGIASSPAIGPDGTIYVGSYDFYLYAINPDGTQKWAYRTGGYITSSPAIGSDGIVYVGSGGYGTDFKLYALNPDGTNKWTFDCAVLWSSPAIGLDGTIYVGSTDGNVYAINPTGTQKWKFQVGDYVYASPAIGYDGTIYVGANNAKLYAINPDGTQKWTYGTGSSQYCSYFSPAIGPDGTIYVGSEYPDNKLHAVNPDGTQKWTFDTGEIYLSAPAIDANGAIYVGSRNRKLYAVNSDGTQKWAFDTGDYVHSSPAIGPDGTIYVGSYDNKLYAVGGASNGPADSPWPMFHNNLHHTGCPDSDGDGMFDNWERRYFTNLSEDKSGDFDSDGLNNLAEFQNFTNPADDDTDDDGLPDGWEVLYHLDPLENDASEDADEDGLSNLDEYLNGFDPNIKAPEVQFSVEPPTGYTPLTVSFQVTSTGAITNWNWDFGDGSSSSAQSPTHTYLQHGTFTIVLSVAGPGGSDVFSVSLYIANPPPVADAGQDQTVNEGVQVLLNGSNSHDPMNDIVAYQWTQIDGSPVTITDDNTVQASFTAPDVGPVGEVLTFQLAVTDSSGLESTDTCVVNVSWINLPPTADAGPNQTVDEGVPVALSGLNSYDPDDGIETYRWMQIGGTPVTLSDQSLVDPTFTAPDVGPDGEALTFQLTVTDKNGLKTDDTCIVNVSWVNVPPTANAGPDQTVNEADQVILSGVDSSDSDDGISSYEWSQTAGAPVLLSDSSAVYPTFTAPDVGPDGEALTFQLTVTDTGGLKSTDTCIINVSWSNLPPVADAGPDQTTIEGSQVILNGFGSSDSDDGIGSYQWTQTAGTPVALSDPTTVYPAFFTPDVGPDGEALAFQLTVTDTGGLKSTDTCIVNVTWNNLPPVADAGTDQTVGEGSQVILNGFGSSDPDDGIATFQWTQTAGSPVQLSDASALYPAFTAPDVGPDGEALTFQLTVTDTGGLKSTDTCIVNVTWSNLPPVADAGTDQTVGEGSQVILNGLGSSDPDDGIATFQWNQTAGPSVQLSDASAVYPAFTAPDVGPDDAALTFQLTVTDTGGLKSTDTCIVNVSWINLPPTADAGPDQIVDEGAPVTLSGLNSYDPDDGIEIYLWMQIGGTPVTLSDQSVVNPTFTAPDVGPDGAALIFQLTVTDKNGLKTDDTCIVNVSWVNVPPTANAGPDQTVNEADQVILSGVDSSDSDDGISSYEWSQTAGAPVLLSDSSAVYPTFTAPDVGPEGEALTFQLTVTDTGGLKSTDTCIINVSWSNLPPVADAGPDQTTIEGSQVILNGFGSSDSDDGIGSYQWTQTAGTSVALSDPTTVYPAFIAPDVGLGGDALAFQLTVTDTGGLKSTDTCIINVSWKNVPPTADAGPDQTVGEGTQAILNGSGSSDPDDGIASYQWTQTAGSPVQLSDASAVYPVFTAPDVGPNGEALIFQLMVTDTGGLKSTDTCIVNVTWNNLPPVVDAGTDQTVGEGSQVILNGFGSSDPDDGIATFQWTQTAGPPVQLSDAAAVYPAFTAPDVGPGGVALTFQLTVTDIGGLKSTDTCIVNVSWSNLPPVADAGLDQTVSEGDQVILSGSNCYDPDNGIASYQWSQTDGPAVMLSDSLAINPVFTAPDVGPAGGVLTFQLTVTDNAGLKSTDTCVVNVSWSNLSPVADAGPDQTVGEGAQVILDGYESSDPDDGISGYQWTQTAGTPVQLSDASAVYPVFIAPDVSPDGEALIFQLTVTDTGGLKSTDTCIVNVTWNNLPPVADAGPDQTVSEGSQVILNGFGSSDPDDGIATFQWTQTAGPPVQLSDAAAVYPAFTAPDVGPDDAALTFQLTVTDTGGLKSTDTCIVNVTWSNLPPVADAGTDQTVGEGSQVILNGFGSSDPDDGIATFQWTQTAGPSVQLSDALALYPAFTAPDVGPEGEALTFQLTVTDTGGLKSTDTCIVNVTWNNLPPVANAGPDQTVSEGSQVILNGFGSSDPDDGIYSHQWTQTFGKPVSLSDPTAVYPGFTAPDVGPGGESLIFQLTVTDASGLKSTDICFVNISWVNQPPTADAGADQTVNEGVLVTLSGSNSYDPDNEIAAYHWRQIDGPVVGIAGFDTAQALITAPDVDSDGILLQFELRVTDIHGLSAVDQVFVNVTWSNEPPVADAGANLIVYQTDLITLDGSNSYDRDGIDIYFWKQISGPKAALSDSNSVKPTITLADTNIVEASLIFKLTVTDTGGLKATDKVIVNILSDNLPPKADAGLNRNVSPNEEVMLDGLNSQDSDGDIASYEWKQIKGPTVILSHPDFVRPTFIAPESDKEGAALKFELTVSDRSGLQDNSTVTVNVINTNSPPLAIAGNMQTEISDEIITLIGTDSYDPDGHIAAYRWRQLQGPKVILSDPLDANPTFSVGESLSSCASLEFGLTVTDNNGLSDTDITIINICDLYFPPVADAGSDMVVEEGDTVTLDASNSYSPAHDSLTYEWKQITGPQVILSNAVALQPTFVAPNVEINDTELIFRLRVKDNHQLCDVSEIVVFIKDNGVFATPPDTISFLTYNNRRLFIECNKSASLVKLKAIDPQNILDPNNRPGNLIYGLMDIQIKVAKPGDTAFLTVHLPEPAPDGYQWFIWDEKNGWRDCGSYAVFNNSRDLLTITLTDGGFGDADVTANGTIVDPAGLGTHGTGVSGSSSAGGCFITTATHSSTRDSYIKGLYEFFGLF